MKKFLLMLVALLWAGQVSAATMYFSADNSFSSVTINGQNIVSDLNLITNADLNDNGLDSTGSGWRSLEIVNYNFLPSTVYEIIWNVANYGGSATSANPLAFIGSVDLGGGTVYNSASTGSGWSFSGTGTLFESAYGSSPWNSPFGSTSMVNNAKWISYQQGDTMQVKLSITTAPVPVPAAVWMLGTGLVAVLGMRRKMAA